MTFWNPVSKVWEFVPQVENSFRNLKKHFRTIIGHSILLLIFVSKLMMILRIHKNWHSIVKLGRHQFRWKYAMKIWKRCWLCLQIFEEISQAIFENRQPWRNSLNFERFTNFPLELISEDDRYYNKNCEKCKKLFEKVVLNCVWAILTK